MNEYQATAAIWLGGWILLGTMFIAVIIWFIAIVINGTERERMKHESCMIETTTHRPGKIDERIEILSYCGDKPNGP